MDNVAANPAFPLSEEPMLAGLLADWTARRQTSGIADKAGHRPNRDRAGAAGVHRHFRNRGRDRRIRCRLIGTGIAQRHGADPTGKYLNDVPQGACPR
jgi:hypothetical protein